MANPSDRLSAGGHGDNWMDSSAEDWAENWSDNWSDPWSDPWVDATGALIGWHSVATFTLECVHVTMLWGQAYAQFFIPIGTPLNAAGITQRAAELVDPYEQLQLTQAQLMQLEKFATLGHMTAALAHEINNPISYVNANLATLRHHLRTVFPLLESLHSTAAAAPEQCGLPGGMSIGALRAEMELMIEQSQEGMARMRAIVQDVKDFSRTDQHDQWTWADLHRGLDSTLNIVSSEIKYQATVVKQYGDLPVIECLPMQLNQVFMNLIVNAAQALGERRGQITVRSGRGVGETVWVEVEDTAGGIAPEHLPQILEPFFTTKATGEGTGLGLAVANNIVHKHHGQLGVTSVPGQGSTFRVSLPIRHRST